MYNGFVICNSSLDVGLAGNPHSRVVEEVLMNQLADFEPVNRRSVRLRFLLLGAPLFLVLIRFLIAAMPTGA